MGEIFKEPKKIVKEKKRTYFRILGVVPSPHNPNNIMGYVILDMQGDRRKYQLRVYGLKQAFALVARYKFDNAIIQDGKIVNSESPQSVKLKDREEKGYPEFNTKKMMLFNPQGQVVGNHCLVILGGIVDIHETITTSKPKGYRVIDFNGQVVDLKEKELLSLVEGKSLEIQNAKILNRGSEGATLSALKGEFPIITKEEVEQVKKEFIVTEADKQKHLEKLIRRAVTSTLYYLGRKNKSWTDKDLNIYIKEYATIQHPDIVKSATSSGDIKSRDLRLKIVAACGLVDYFVKDKVATSKSNWVFSHIGNEDFVDYFIKGDYLYSIFKKSGQKDLEKMMKIITLEHNYLSKARQELDGVKLLHNHAKNGYNCKPKGVYIEYIVKNAYNNDFKGIENEVLDLYKSIKNKKTVKYLEEMPIFYSMTYKKYDKVLSKVDGSNIIKLNMTSNKGIKAIGYTVKKSEDGQTSKDNILYGPNKPLRYALADIYLEKDELSQITKRTTCLGDLLITRKLLMIHQDVFVNSNTSSREVLEYVNIDQMGLVKESLMIILAIYNLELALYLNNKYNLVELDLDSIGKEEFNIDESDRIFYQTGCKFNKPEIVKGMSWSKHKISEMPYGLRGAISLNTTKEISKYLENTLDILYQEIQYGG